MIKIDHVSKSFKISNDRSLVALNDINYSFPNFGLFYIVGKSGSGKSTLLNIIAGLIEPDSGKVEFEGKEISKMKSKDKENYLKNDISILFQKYNLIEDMTVKENLDVALSIKGIDDNNNYNKLLEDYGLDSKKDQIVQTLSGGEKQRLALVRSLIGNPKVLLCDEPTGALDKENSDYLINELINLSKEMLVIVVTHNLKYLKRYKSGFLKLENGNLVGKWIPKKQDKNIERKQLKKKRNEKFIFDMARKNIKKNRKRNIISSVSAGFSFLLLVISTFFNSSISHSKTTLINSYVDSNSFSVSEITYEEIEDSPLKLMKNKRPKYNDVYTLLDGKPFLISYSFDYFFSDMVCLKNSTFEFDKFSCKPIYDDSLKDGEVIINKAFYDSAIAKSKNFPFSSPLSLYIKKDIVYFSEFSSQTITDTFETQIDINIKTIQEEFSYMNEPTLYYSSQFMEKVFKETEATNSSQDRGEYTTFYNLIDECKESDEIGDYSYYIFALETVSNKYAYSLMDSFSNEDKIHLENFGYTMTTSFIALSKTIFLVINILVFIALILSLFICGFLAYSSSLLNRKESAILSSLGASKNSIYQIYVYEQGAYSILGIFLGVLFSLLVISIMNFALKDFFITNSFIKVDTITIILFSLLMVFFEVCVAFFPLKIMKARKIHEELKEE